MPHDALPGIRTDQDTFFAMVKALYDAIDAFQVTHPACAPLPLADVIHAAKCFTVELLSQYAALSAADETTDEPTEGAFDA